MSLDTLISHNLGQTTRPLRDGGCALVLMGGGARTAYQAGVLKAIAAMQAEVDAQPSPERLEEDATGTIESYTVGYAKGRPARGVVIARTDKGRIVARPADADKEAALAALIDPMHDPIGRTVTIRHADGVNAFTVDA